MAQVAVLSTPRNASFSTASATVEETFEMQQCEKLVKFCEEVYSGAHGRIKPPQPTTKPSASIARPNLSHGTATGNGRGGRRVSVNGERRQASANLQSFQENSQRHPQTMPWSVPGLGFQSPAASGALSSLPSAANGVKTAIDPVLLEKSPDLLKAEIQLRRQRLERDLRDQLQERAVEKASQLASDFLCSVDLTDVMAKSMAPATPPAAPSTDNAVANATASSDSFDDNTFYSSQHDTPESHQMSRVPHESEDDEMREGSPYEPELDAESLLPHVQVQQPAQSVLPPQPAPQPAPTTASSVPGLSGFMPNAQIRGPIVPANVFYDPSQDNAAVRSGINRGAIQFQPSTGESRSAGSGSNDREARAPDRRDMRRFGDHLLDQTLGHRRSPLVRAHNLSPVAPQPEHVSLLVSARSSALGHRETTTHEATPPQVAVLRNAQSAGSSPDNSQQADKAGKRKNKKNKRKADRLGADTAARSPYVKSEPRSPSPMSLQQHARPNKRQRQGQGQFETEPIYVDGGPNDHLATEARYRNGHLPEGRRGEAIRESYEPREELHPRYAPGGPIVRYEHRFHEDGRQPAGVYRLEPSLQDSYAPRQVVRERVIRTVSQPFVERPYRDMRPYSRDARDAAGLGASMGVEHVRSRSPLTYEGPGPAMVAPSMTGRRIIVDELGREYYEPPRPSTVIREPVGHGPRQSGSNLEYDPLAPARAMSRRPDTFGEDDESGYRRSYAGPRRLLTQPDLSSPEYRGYRERDYGAQQLGPPEQQYMAARGDLRNVNDPPREFLARATSVRPPERYDPQSGYESQSLDDHPRAASVRPAEPIRRFEMSHGYERRLGLVEEPVREEYSVFGAASVRPPESVRYSEAPVSRDYRVGSVRPETQLREFAGMARPAMYRESMPPPPPPEARPGYGTVPQVNRPGYDPRQPELHRQEQPFRNDDLVYMPQRQYYD